MQENAHHQAPFSVGDVVAHTTRGVGRVTQITDTPEPRLVIHLKDGTLWSVTISLATTTLAKLPPDGLEAQITGDRDAIKDWEGTAPLKLLALALTDISAKAAKPAQLKAKLMANRLLSTKWESWWKKVQPALKNSPYFMACPDGTYRLLTSPDQIPAMSLPRVGKKKETRLTQSQLVELLKRLETKEVKFEDIEGAKRKHQLARELVLRSREEAQFKEILTRSLSGPARPAGILLQELLKNGSTGDIAQSLESLLDHIAALVPASTQDSGATSAEHLCAKLSLYKDNLAKVLSRHDLAVGGPIPAMTRKLLDMAVQLSRDESLGWRGKVTDSLLQSLGKIVARQPDTLATIGRTLATTQTRLHTCVTVGQRILETIPTEQKTEATRRLVAGALSYSIDFADRLIQNLQPRASYIRWWVHNLKDVVGTPKPDTPAVMEALLERICSRIGPRELNDCLELTTSIALVCPRMAIPQVAREKISEWARSVSLSESSGEPLLNQAAFSPFVIAIQARLEKERETWCETSRRMQSEISEQQNSAVNYQKTILRLESIIDELKSDFRLPEKWTEYRAKKEVIERLGVLYQEILATSTNEQDSPLTRWILNRIETILIQNGASIFGEVNTLVAFDPFQHEFVRGAETSEKQVRIRCPGFQWKDPTGNAIVLVRARVAREWEGQHEISPGN